MKLGFFQPLQTEDMGGTSRGALREGHKVIPLVIGDPHRFGGPLIDSKVPSDLRGLVLSCCNVLGQPSCPHTLPGHLILLHKAIVFLISKINQM